MVNQHPSVSRRQFMAVSSPAIATILAGCYDYPPASRLAIDELTIEKTDSTYVLDFVVENHNVRQNTEADFHDVTVVGYTNDGDLICEERIGDVTYEFDNNDGKPVTMECSQYPHLITFSAEETPCEDDVIINVAVYNEEDESWLFDRYTRDCNEGIPPKPRE